MLRVPTTSRARNAATPETAYAFARGRLTIAKGRKAEAYRVAEFTPDLPGRAFTLTKPGGDRYACLVANAQDGLCECRGFDAQGHCKHLDTLRAMLAAGELDAGPVSPADGRTPAQRAEAAGVALPF